MSPHNDSTRSFSERLVDAFVSTFAAAATLLVLPWVFAAKGGESFTLYVWIFSKMGLVIIASAAVAGFLLGSEKMANAFSFFWGTHSIWQEEWFQKCFLGLVIIVLVGVVGHLAFTR